MKTTLVIFFSFFAYVLLGQDINPVEERLLRQLKVFPQEKIHVHTDKSTYVSGEKIWYRAYIVDATLHTPKILSRYIYVDLISPVGELISRSKLRPDSDSAFHNNIELPEDLPEGIYMIRAFTNFMRSREDYFFEKKIFIADPQSFLYQIHPEFIFDEKNCKLKLNIYDTDSKPVEVENLTIRVDTGKMKKSEGEFSFKITPDKRQSLYFEFDKNNRKYKKYIPVPEDDFDVSFFPEGGYLVDNVPCRIGIKALKSSGYAENITGEVFDNTDNQIGTFNSVHAGMGSFYLKPEQGKTYYAVCKNPSGKTKRYPLPAARPDASVLKLVQNKSKLYINVLQGSAVQEKPLNLLVHIRGVVIYSGAMPASNSISIDKSALPSGVIQTLLMDENMNVLSERLFFYLNKIELPKIELTTNKSEYKKREAVFAKVRISDEADNPLEGNFSVAVTDNNDVVPDSSFTILSELLLSSEIKGYIENPAHYLTGSSDADYLMLTQGWRRYNIPRVLKDTLEKPVHYLEAGQEISGTVKRVLGSKVNENNSVTMFSPAGHFDMTVSDENGRFSFNGFEFPDSTIFVVQALNKKGSKFVELILDQETYPPIMPFVVPEFKPDSLFKEYVEKSDQKFTDEFGMRVTVLKEVTITGRKDQALDADRKGSMYSSNFNTVMTSDRFETARDLSQALMLLPGVSVTGTSVSIRGSSVAPVFIVDDVIWDDFNLTDINIRDIERIEVMKGSEAAILGSRGAGGAIIIVSKTGKINTNVVRFNVKSITPKGYKKDVEFYSPKYDGGPAPAYDRRTTIYWKPSVRLNEGNGEFEFYTADVATTYSIIVEGITKDGRIIRKMQKISRQ